MNTQKEFIILKIGNVIWYNVPLFITIIFHGLFNWLLHITLSVWFPESFQKWTLLRIAHEFQSFTSHDTISVARQEKVTGYLWFEHATLLRATHKSRPQSMIWSTKNYWITVGIIWKYITNVLLWNQLVRWSYYFSPHDGWWQWMNTFLRTHGSCVKSTFSFRNLVREFSLRPMADVLAFNSAFSKLFIAPRR